MYVLCNLGPKPSVYSSPWDLRGHLYLNTLFSKEMEKWALLHVWCIKVDKIKHTPFKKPTAPLFKAWLFLLISGLLLGCCLLILVCTISEEFGSAGGGGGRSHLGGSRSKLSSTASSSPLKSESGMISHGYFGSSGGSRDQYSYGWSFILATLGFLGSELSALLCLAAFLNRFDSEVMKF